jgi:hypothetical protein
MTWQNINHGAQSIFFFGLTWIGENIFELIGALGVLVNIVFVVKSRIEQNKINKIDIENKILEQEVLRRKLERAD